MTYRNVAILAACLLGLAISRAVDEQLTTFVLSVIGAGAIGYVAIQYYGDPR